MAAVLLVVFLCGSTGMAWAAGADADQMQTPTAVSPAREPLFVRYRHDLLSVRADGVPLSDVLDAIEAETGLQFTGEAFDQRDVWKRFDGVPLADALRRVIGRQNFILVYGEDGAPVRVSLLGVPQQPPTGQPRGAAAAKPSFLVLWRRAAPVPVSARVARALGSGQDIPTVQLTRALRVDDPAVRQDAVDTFLLALRRDASLRSTFLALPDAQIAGLVRAWAGPHADHVLRLLAARTRYSDVRALANRVLSRVRS